jgi:CDP-diacylglycerol--glycerol-3-phosphate 3-phosphatidyltransferase
MLKNIPNILTLIRILLIPVFIFIFYFGGAQGHFIAGIIFALACITDWWDGYLARRLHQTTKLGAFLDPVADKLIVTAALIVIVGSKSYHYIAVPAIVIIGREIVISALREWMAEIGQRAHVAVATIAKWKTLIQMLAIFLLLIYRPHSTYLIAILGYIALYLAMLLTLWTMCMYLYAARKSFKEQ